ncbi:cell division protein FtsQ/DivIB [uncultured Varibaculum sp.]|uniref:cell division protein FtsQ/DivIB n=1 Tax=uncultured Varibaculum sp. TaxID=413896 RepID=UPI00258D27B5|nr:FtsQ-type POTRA domain-containing protein [uncultured Varibaculum sp.]
MTSRKSSFSRRAKATEVSKNTRGRTNRRQANRGEKAVSLPQSRKVTLASKDRAVISSGLAQRREEIAQIKRRKRLRRGGIGALIVVIIVALGYLFWLSPVFAYDPDKTRIVGASAQVSAQQVKEELSSYAGKPLMRVPTGQIAATLQKENPWIKEIGVSREFPRGMVVHLTLRSPVAKTAQGSLVDLEGNVFPAKGFEVSNLVTIASSCRANDNRDCLKSAASVVESLPPEIKKKTKQAQAARPENIELQLKSGQKVIWGASTDNQKKAQVLSVLLQRGGSVYNVTDYAHPTIIG